MWSDNIIIMTYYVSYRRHDLWRLEEYRATALARLMGFNIFERILIKHKKRRGYFPVKRKTILTEIHAHLRRGDTTFELEKNLSII